MAPRFKVESVSGVPSASFEGNNEEAWVLESFLSEATSFYSYMIDTLNSVTTVDSHPVQFSGNEIFFDVYPDRVVITAEWIKDKSGNECKVTLPLEEAKQLLLEWGKVLEKHLRRY